MRHDRGIRWWPFVTLLGLTAVAVAWIWLVGVGRQRQDRFLFTVLVGFVAFAATLLWWLLLSRARL